MERAKARFGPAGNCTAFYDEGMKSTIQAPGWLEMRGLTAYEYQCGRGVNVSEETARKLGAKAAEHGVEISVHAPYFISLASADEQKRENSLRYILESARTVQAMGGRRIVVHLGGLGGVPRGEAAALAAGTLARAQAALDDAGLGAIQMCPEVMGKINQLGDLDEVLLFCGVDERLLPCVDFGHLYARTHGEVNSREAFAAVLDRLENRLGAERARRLHIHFSKIEYTAGGEKKHLTFEDTAFGPEPGPLMALLAERGCAPVVICESNGTQAEDAAVLMALYNAASGEPESAGIS